MSEQLECIKEEIFLRVKRVVKAQPNQTLVISDLAEVITNKELQDKLEKVKVKEVTEKAGQSMIVTALEIIRAIKREFPQSGIKHLGEADVIVDIEENFQNNLRDNQPSRLYIFAIGIILFFGAAMAIMNFHADVSMVKVHQQIYKLIMGESKENPLLLNIPYSIGLGFGMIVFFNQIYKYKFNKKDPSPLEIEMYLYKNKVNQFSLHQKTELAKKSDQ
ncbi:stage V sporulation protein AA [Orenia metallireducens]|uniref:Stage V sporulation protein AA n=1 Tax=Orenia metallireducens TaxID=1413210 RepID=A0A1C0A9N9_9FIRM|nr:stage V sporulation protein AA [Orenia metallireducens]OCL27004.1 stage V sporulation protein AA [Orenia metallireducens]